ncbi:MAG: zinc-ribbon domain-containing protein [Ruminococcaceae bacterium]|nr:zinc-ribbon domain-containing protein [Oscillospiraceae bacterium]
MKICPKCNTQVADDATFCTGCGVQFAPVQPTAYAPAYDPFDHTSEFDAKDISDNKVIAMLVYLLGPIGIIIALLASNTSAYAAFHVRQALKITVVEILSLICAALLCWTVIVPIAYGIFALILTVIKFICFFQICSGKAKEPAIIKNFGFLR